jgi:hypothetical protein
LEIVKTWQPAYTAWKLGLGPRPPFPKPPELKTAADLSEGLTAALGWLDIAREMVVSSRRKLNRGDSQGAVTDIKAAKRHVSFARTDLVKIALAFRKLPMFFFWLATFGVI